MNKEFEDMCSLLKTKPRSAEAMQDAREMKAYIMKYSRCYNCGSECNSLSSDMRYNGVCKKCGAIYSRMITTKNKLIARDYVGKLALSRYRYNIANMKYLPVPLRGNGTKEQLLDAIDTYMEAMP